MADDRSMRRRKRGLASDYLEISVWTFKATSVQSPFAHDSPSKPASPDARQSTTVTAAVS